MTKQQQQCFLAVWACCLPNKGEYWIASRKQKQNIEIECDAIRKLNSVFLNPLHFRIISEELHRMTNLPRPVRNVQLRRFLERVRVVSVERVAETIGSDSLWSIEIVLAQLWWRGVRNPIWEPNIAPISGGLHAKASISESLRKLQYLKGCNDFNQEF